MGIFSRTAGPHPFLPEGAPAKLDSYGRAEGPLQNGDPAGTTMMMEPVRRGLLEDPDRCLKEVREAANQGGGWALYAAVDMLEALLRDFDDFFPRNELLESDTYLDIVDAAVLFMRQQAYPSGSLTRAMRDRWVSAEGALFLYDNLEEVSPSSAVTSSIADLEPGERRLLVRQNYPFDPGGIEEVSLVKSANGVSLVGTLDGKPSARDTWRMTPEFASPLEAVACLGTEIRCDRGVIWMHDDVPPHLPLREAVYPQEDWASYRQCSKRISLGLLGSHQQDRRRVDDPEGDDRRHVHQRIDDQRPHTDSAERHHRLRPAGALDRRRGRRRPRLRARGQRLHQLHPGLAGSAKTKNGLGVARSSARSSGA